MRWPRSFATVAFFLCQTAIVFRLVTCEERRVARELARSADAGAP